ncbi:hypothetical protein BGZ94_007974 [Podila epigama]|nr:hypothetical protein BGZ94_007974 [Podila epigama]
MTPVRSPHPLELRTHPILAQVNVITTTLPEVLLLFLTQVIRRRPRFGRAGHKQTYKRTTAHVSLSSVTSALMPSTKQCAVAARAEETASWIAGPSTTSEKAKAPERHTQVMHQYRQCHDVVTNGADCVECKLRIKQQIVARKVRERIHHHKVHQEEQTLQQLASERKHIPDAELTAFDIPPYQQPRR